MFSKDGPIGKSQEIPNFELTNSVSDDSSVDTVDISVIKSVQ